MLGYAPYPMKLDATRLGLVFTGWGLLVALFSVFVAPRLQARFGTAPVLYVNLAALAVVLAVTAAGVGTPPVVIAAVIASGAFIGVNNTLTTQAVMLVSPVERPVASSAYGFVRFIGGGLAPFAAGKLADATSLSIPFYLGAGTFVLAIGVLATGHKLISAAETRQAEGEPVLPRLEPVTELPGPHDHPVIVAVGAAGDAARTVAAGARIAHDLGSPLEVIHVYETTVVEETAIDAEDNKAAHDALCRHLDRLVSLGIPATGQLLHSVGDHAAAGRVLARHANEAAAPAVAIGASPRGPAEQFADGSFTTALTHAAAGTVVLVRPEQPPHRLTVDTLAGLRSAGE